jgi:peptidoglycan/xylan/chitin deacetylase (PgdA/CDA1 family)
VNVVKEIPVLVYHNVGHYPADAMEDGLQPEPFNRQIRFLSEHAYNVVSLDQALDHLTGGIKLSTKSIAITIDGGYQDAYTNVLRVLKRYNFHATFFIIPEFMGSETTIGGVAMPCLTWDEVHAQKTGWV